MLQHRDRICIQKIIQEISIGMDLIGDATLEQFLENEMMKRAVSMTVINIGELIKNVTDELRNNHREIPWKAVAGMREKILRRMLHYLSQPGLGLQMERRPCRPLFLKVRITFYNINSLTWYFFVI